MGEHSPQPLHKPHRIVPPIVTPLYQCVFKGDSAPCFLCIVLTGIEEFVKRKPSGPRHQLPTEFIISRVKRDGQRHSHVAIGKFSDAMGKPTGGYRYVSKAKSPPLLLPHQGKKSKQRVIVVKWFPAAHHDHMGDSDRRLLGRRVYLLDHLARRKVSNQTS